MTVVVGYWRTIFSLRQRSATNQISTAFYGRDPPNRRLAIARNAKGSYDLKHGAARQQERACTDALADVRNPV
ncbi:hypothetical protein ACWKW6_33695 [Dyadobacter jiangsuensis]